MANLINLIITVILDRRIAAEQNRANREAIRELEAYNDNELTELGIARSDIHHAVKYGYTERGSNDHVPAYEYEQAVHELESYSDQDLDDLGLARRDIFQVVKYGRRNDVDSGDVPVSGCTGIL
jgi:uncharacterized protein YjiS (DUF1127 family)